MTRAHQGDQGSEEPTRQETEGEANLSDGGQVCPICNGAGYLIKDLPVGHPDFGKLYPCKCTLDKMAFRKSERLHEMSNLGPLQDMVFENFEIDGLAGTTQPQRRILRQVKMTARHFAQEPQGWLLFTGSFGSGKTHLAAAIANYRLKIGQPALFVVVPDLLDHLRATFSPHSTVTYDRRFEEVRTHPLLILDDLGAQSSTPWAEEKLFQILNHRYNAELPTVITTNLTPDQFAPRIRSRLSDFRLVDTWPIPAPDHRGGKGEQDINPLDSLDQHRNQTFETFNPYGGPGNQLSPSEQHNLQEAFDTARQFASRSSEVWLVLQGTNGVGKTHLAAAIANEYKANQERAESTQKPLFVVVPDLLDHLRATFDPRSEISYDKLFDLVRKAPMLVLDDLGTESATNWAQEKLFQILNYRYTNRERTVITTSREISQLDPPIRTRMYDTSVCVIKVIQAKPFYQRPDHIADMSSAPSGGRFRNR